MTIRTACNAFCTCRKYKATGRCLVNQTSNCWASKWNISDVLVVASDRFFWKLYQRDIIFSVILRSVCLGPRDVKILLWRNLVLGRFSFPAFVWLYVSMYHQIANVFFSFHIRLSCCCCCCYIYELFFFRKVTSMCLNSSVMNPRTISPCPSNGSQGSPPRTKVAKMPFLIFTYNYQFYSSFCWKSWSPLYLKFNYFIGNLCV